MRGQSQSNPAYGRLRYGKPNRNREKILSTAGRLFFQKGFKETSLNTIAKTARVNKATIYYHFKNKMSILFEISVSAIDEIMQNGRTIIEADSDADVKMAALIENHMRWLVNHQGRVGFYPLLKINLTPGLFSEYLEMRAGYLSLFQKVISAGIAEGKFHPLNSDLNPMFIVTLLNSLIQNVGVQKQTSLEEMVSSVSKHVTQALKSPPPHAFSGDLSIL